MITICLNGDAIKANGLTIDEVLLLIATQNKVDFESAEKKLIASGMITAERDTFFHQTGWRLTQKGIDTLNNVIIDSEKAPVASDKLEVLATTLKGIFPKGKKEGTNIYWTEGIPLIIRRLKLFFKKYGASYSDEQIIEAAKSYVASFNGDYRFMKVLKYFMFKEKKVSAGVEVESESELITYIENAGQEDLNREWLNEVR